MQILYPNIGAAEYVRTIGIPAKIVYWEKKLTAQGIEVKDNYNNFVWEEKVKHITAVQTYQTSTKVPVKVNSEFGQYRGFDFEFFTADDIADLVEIGASERPAEIVIKGRRHRINEVDPTPLGIYRIVGEQMRTGNG